MGRFLTTDVDGGIRFKPLTIPLIIALICGSIVAAMATSGEFGAGLGMAVGAVAATALIVFAARARPAPRIEVAKAADGRHRVLVVATAEPSTDAAQHVAQLAGAASDVRLVVPLQSNRLDRWFSAEDDARREAEGLLARSAGALVAAGLPVSGSVGDNEPAQAMEDELRGFAADEVVLLTGIGKDPLARVEARLGIPLRRVSA